MSILCLFKLEMYDSNMAASVIIKYYLTKKIKKKKKKQLTQPLKEKRLSSLARLWGCEMTN